MDNIGYHEVVAVVCSCRRLRFLGEAQVADSTSTDAGVLVLSVSTTEEEGIGGFRTAALLKYLNTRSIAYRTVSRAAIGEPLLKWAMRCLAAVWVGREKSVYISCGPFRDLLPLAITAKLRRKRLLVDFRDPWSWNIRTSYGSGLTGNSLRYRIARSIERWVLELCDVFIVCTPGVELYYRTLTRDPAKVICVQNGFPESELRQCPVTSEKDRSQRPNFQVVCLGKFAEYGIDNVSRTLSKLKDFARRNNIQRISLRVVGGDTPANRSWLSEANLPAGIEVALTPLLSRYDALAVAADADAGIVVLREEERHYGTKIYDYIAIGLPVVDTFDHGSAFYREFGRFCIHSVHDVVDWGDRLVYSREARYPQYDDIFLNPAN